MHYRRPVVLTFSLFFAPARLASQRETFLEREWRLIRTDASLPAPTGVQGSLVAGV